MKKKHEDDLLENAFNTVSASAKNSSNVRTKSASQLKKTLNEHSHRRSESGTRSNRLSDLAVDVDDAGSVVSGLKHRLLLQNSNLSTGGITISLTMT